MNNQIEKPKQEVLTLNRLRHFGDVSQGLDFAKEFLLLKPEKPSKPFLKNNATSGEAKQYGIALEKYEKEMVAYENELYGYKKHNNKINNIIEEYIKDAAGFDKVPQKSKEKVWSKAYSDGHSFGYHEVYTHLVDLVDLFN